MSVCAVICEYNPFHKGHARQFRLIRDALGADTAILCLMSGPFVQRGEPAIFLPLVRAQAALEAGADLVLGHHSHRINPIEEYNGKYIVYSLGNFSFAGHNKPSDMLTYLFQIRFKYRRGEMFGTDFRIIPCRISSKQDYNDFAVTPLTESRYIDTILSTLRNYGSKVDHPVENYPLEWD